MKKIVALVVAVFILVGCAAGVPVDWSKARAVKVGMTDKQLQDVMGAPYMVRSQGDRQVWVYVNVDAFMGTKSVSYILRDGKVIEVPAIPDSFK